MMELYAKTELENFYNLPQFDFGPRFVTIRHGWHSWAFIMDPADKAVPRFELRRKALSIVAALMTLEGDKEDTDLIA